MLVSSICPFVCMIVYVCLCTIGLSLRVIFAKFHTHVCTSQEKKLLVLGTIRSNFNQYMGQSLKKIVIFWVQAFTNTLRYLGNCKWCETGYKLVSYSNRESHTGFRLLPRSVILNGVIAVLLGNFIEFAKKTLYFCFNIRHEFGPVLNTPNPFQLCCL